MPKRNMTPEEKKAWGEKMKAARAKKAAIAQQSVNIADEGLKAAAAQTNSGETSFADLQKQVAEIQETNALLKAALLTREPAPQQPGLVGTFEKYITNPAHYPDPRQRLAGESRLTRFAFTENWELGFKIETTRYQTIDKIWEEQPKFTLQLIWKVRDDDGELTNKRAGRAQMVFFEDPAAAMAVAREKGLSVDSNDEKAFLDEMRYLRMRDWLLECFYPPKAQSTNNKREEVIAGRLMDTWEVSSESTASIPFDQLKKKL